MQLAQELLVFFVAAPLVYAGLSKVRRRREWTARLENYRLAAPVRGLLDRIAPWAELSVGVSLLLWPTAFAAGLSLLVYGMMTLVLLFSWQAGAQGKCGCFGGVLDAPIGPVAVTRAALLVLASIVLLATTSSSVEAPRLAVAMSVALIALLADSLAQVRATAGA